MTPLSRAWLDDDVDDAGAALSAHGQAVEHPDAGPGADLPGPRLAAAPGPGQGGLQV